MPHNAYTVADANALIPRLEETFGEIRRHLNSIGDHADRLQILDLLWGEKLLSRENPDHEEAGEFRRRIAELSGEIERIVEREILGRGLRFPQGGLERGLVDFPTTWQGRWIFLCWQLGEPEIQAWHEVDGGFAGRQGLTPEQSREMGRRVLDGEHDEETGGG